MHTDTLPARIDLAHRAVVAVDDPSEVNFTCREGTVWLTLDGDPRDFVLEAGDSFRTSEHRRALIYGLSPARLDLDAGARAQPVRRPSQGFRPVPAISGAH
ncbi:hypothetical protein GCM10027034_01960 [Ramlibacter solisilvae]|uniref:DUF2917 domain-containing protein n=1 Tax=Ramlibacter tataouinensis TaxID=94132 RepID=A0A127JNW8_9BURK|nr:DUF2917 domain-containing protein [Ramlibacter tataouinensis]AMO21697.1 hypothetical protein UC35_00935 [Ramlibacter tataouinensis]